MFLWMITLFFSSAIQVVSDLIYGTENMALVLQCHSVFSSFSAMRVISGSCTSQLSEFARENWSCFSFSLDSIVCWKTLMGALTGVAEAESFVPKC